jgi:nuclear transport factor 2 (NTF2) superfamily protein
VSAPALPRTTVEAARAALAAAEDAWRTALQAAVANHGDWRDVQQASEVTHQARAALTQAEREA